MRYTPIFLIVLLAATPLHAAQKAPEWRVDESATKVRFEADYDGNPLTGEIPVMKPTVRFDPDNLGGSYIHLSFPLKGIETRDMDARATLPKKGWFDIDNFPKASFGSRSIVKIGEDRYRASGILTIKKIPAPLEIEFEFKEYSLTKDKARLKAVAEGNAVVKRSAYQIGQGEWSKPHPLADEVKITFIVTAMRLVNPSQGGSGMEGFSKGFRGE